MSSKGRKFQGLRDCTYGGSLVYDYPSNFNIESLDGSTVWDKTEADRMPAVHAGSEW
jgi:hypothetical protein